MEKITVPSSMPQQLIRNSKAEGAPDLQVYTGYFWFCTVYFVLAIIVTHFMMRYPPLGQQRSTWMAWVKVRHGLVLLRLLV